MGPIVKAQLGLERAGEGKVIKNFATAYNEGKFTTGDLYFQKFASGTDNLMKKSTSSFRFRPGVKGYWCDARRRQSGTATLSALRGPMGIGRAGDREFDNVNSARINDFIPGDKAMRNWDKAEYNPVSVRAWMDLSIRLPRCSLCLLCSVLTRPSPSLTRVCWSPVWHRPEADRRVQGRAAVVGGSPGWGAQHRRGAAGRRRAAAGGGAGAGDAQPPAPEQPADVPDHEHGGRRPGGAPPSHHIRLHRPYS
jgi:hypothetical protein